MATINNIINVNSSYSHTTDLADLTSVELKMWIYRGTQGVGVAEGVILGASNDRPIGATYILKGTAVANGSTNITSFEIASLIKDFIESNFNESYVGTNTVWVDIQAQKNVGGVTTDLASEQYLGLDGYEYQTDVVEDYNNVIRLSTRHILKSSEQAVSIPVLRQKMIGYSFERSGQSISSGVLSDFSSSNESDNQIVYLNNVSSNLTSFRQRVLDAQLGNRFENNKCLERVECDFEIFEVDKVVIEYDSTLNTLTAEDIAVEVITFDNVMEHVYEPKKLTFVNKYGAYQDVWFFKNTARALKVKSDTFNRRRLLTGDTTSRATKVRSNTIVNETLSLNSGFYPESNNSVFEELMQSNNVWLWSDEVNEFIRSEAHAVLIKDSSFNFKDGLTDKLINYSLTIEYAFNKMKQL